MDSPEFNEIVDKVLARVQEVLVLKGTEYVPEGEPSRFHNFETAAAFNQQLSTEALWGFLTKHLVSLSDMVKVDSTDHSLGRWDEKITDSLVYLVLLYGIVNENEKLAARKQAIKQETIGVEAQRRAPSIVLHTENP
uniref:MazG-like nucleotide pyrophosphohydrolase n=1 Tax=Gordonia phage Petito TaxID=3158876 RepID=A0AAU8GTF7_9CAUD